MFTLNLKSGLSISLHDATPEQLLEWAEESKKARTRPRRSSYTISLPTESEQSNLTGVMNHVPSTSTSESDPSPLF